MTAAPEQPFTYRKDARISFVRHCAPGPTDRLCQHGRGLPLFSREITPALQFEVSELVARMTRDLADIVGRGVHIYRRHAFFAVSALEVVSTARARQDYERTAYCGGLGTCESVSVQPEQAGVARAAGLSASPGAQPFTKPVQPTTSGSVAGLSIASAGAWHGFILGRHDARGKHEEQSEETAADGHDFWYQPSRRRQFQERAKRLRARAVHTVGLGARAKCRLKFHRVMQKANDSTVVTVRIDRFPSTVQSTQHRAPPKLWTGLVHHEGVRAAVGPHTQGAGHPWLPPMTALSGSQVVPHIESG